MTEIIVNNISLPLDRCPRFAQQGLNVLIAQTPLCLKVFSGGSDWKEWLKINGFFNEMRPTTQTFIT